MEGYRLGRAVALGLALVLATASGGCGGDEPTAEQVPARPHFEPGFNLFSSEQDVQLGRQSAEQIVQQVPLLRDPEVQAYVSDLGSRLAAKAPGAAFPYEFRVLDVDEVNAFALPGGFIFVTRGAIEAARDEGELAGVVAHEIAHVALRHGTNQASKAYVAETGLGILSQILEGDESALGDVVNVIGGLGLNAVFLKFGRTAEREADQYAAMLLADAGYDPADLADFFRTLEELHAGARPPEFLSDHPNPGNRIRSIEELKPALEVHPDPIRDTEAFRRVKARLRALPPARVENVQLFNSLAPARESRRPDPPAQTTERYTAPGAVYQVDYPENWIVLANGGRTAAFAPRGGYGELDGGAVFTHGVLTGVTETSSADLRRATEEFVRAQLETNPEFRVVAEPSATTVGGRPGLQTVISGPSTVSNWSERDVIYTTMLPDGRLFYAITVSPEDEADAYRPAFARFLESLQIG